MTLLSVNKVSCGYQQAKVLDDISFELEKNQIVSLLGASGCGKTTLLNSIAGLHNIDTGSIALNQVTLSAPGKTLAPEKRSIGMIFQEYALFPHMTVAQNVAFGKNVAKSDVRQWLTLVNLEALAERYPHQLSGGQQQRVAIARALAAKPDLLLLDEPFSNIDQHLRSQLIDDIRRILKDTQTSAIFVTHSIDEACRFSDKLVILGNQSILQQGAPKDIYQHPASVEVASFFGPVNVLPAYIKQGRIVSQGIGLIAKTTQGDHKAGEWLIRPKQIVIDSENGTRFQVKQQVFQGGKQSLVVTANDTQLTVEMDDTIEVSPGDSIKLSVVGQQTFFPSP